MNGFNVGRVFVVVALAATVSTGCARSRGGGSYLVSSVAESLPPRRSEAMQTGVADNAPSEKAQQNCPVTGEELGSMGQPIPVNVKGRTIRVCCEGCVAAVRNDPDKYLKIVDDELRRSDASSKWKTTVDARSAAGESDFRSSGTHHH